MSDVANAAAGLTNSAAVGVGYEAPGDGPEIEPPATKKVDKAVEPVPEPVPAVPAGDGPEPAEETP